MFSNKPMDNRNLKATFSKGKSHRTELWKISPHKISPFLKLSLLVYQGDSSFAIKVTGHEKNLKRTFKFYSKKKKNRQYRGLSGPVSCLTLAQVLRPGLSWTLYSLGRLLVPLPLPWFVLSLSKINAILKNHNNNYIFLQCFNRLLDLFGDENSMRKLTKSPLQAEVIQNIKQRNL